MGYVMLPLMALVGVMFSLPLVYYIALVALTGFVTLRLVQKRQTVFGGDKADTAKLLRVGEVLSKDFVIVAIAFTLTLMLCSLLKITPIMASGWL